MHICRRKLHLTTFAATLNPKKNLGHVRTGKQERKARRKEEKKEVKKCTSAVEICQSESCYVAPLYGDHTGSRATGWLTEINQRVHTCMIEARLYGNCRSCWVRKAGWKHTVWKENNEGKVMDIPAAHNDAQGLSVMRSAPKLRPRTPMSGLVLPSCAQRRPWPAQAGTGTCVHIPIQLIPIASLAWLGKQQPCPLLFCNFLLGTEVDTHTHTHIFSKRR